MATLNDLYPDTLDRIEEAQPPAGPVFWSLTGEVLPQMVDAMFEASLVTGIVQMNNVQVTIPAETTYIMGLPKGAIAPIRMRAPYPIRKASLKGMDDMLFDWQTRPTGTQVAAWFPLGVSGFGIFPQLTADAKVTMDFIASPVNKARPYDGTEAVPFPQQFTDFLARYAAVVLRMKEAGVEAEEAAQVNDEYLSLLKDISLFQSRIDSLVRTGSYGSRVQTNQRTSV